MVITRGNDSNMMNVSFIDNLIKIIKLYNGNDEKWAVVENGRRHVQGTVHYSLYSIQQIQGDPPKNGNV